MSSPAVDPGLCGGCRHVRVIRNRRGSAFHLCRRSETDPRFRRYPPLPVLECFGFEPADEPAAEPAAKPADGPEAGPAGDPAEEEARPS